jgi:hypothetical protein
MFFYGSFVQLLLWTSHSPSSSLLFAHALVTVPLPPMSITLYSNTRDQYTLDLLKSAVVQSAAYLDDYFVKYYNSTTTHHNHNNNNQHRHTPTFSKVDLYLNSGGIRPATSSNGDDDEDEDEDEDEEEQEQDNGQSYSYYAMINVGGYACYLDKGETATHVRQIVFAAMARDNYDTYMTYLAESGDSFLEGLVDLQVEWLEYRPHAWLQSALAIGLGALGALLAVAAVLWAYRRPLQRKFQRWMLAKRQSAKAMRTTSAEVLERQEELISSKEKPGEEPGWAYRRLLQRKFQRWMAKLQSAKANMRTRHQVVTSAEALERHEELISSNKEEAGVWS